MKLKTYVLPSKPTVGTSMFRKVQRMAGGAVRPILERTKSARAGGAACNAGRGDGMSDHFDPCAIHPGDGQSCSCGSDPPHPGWRYTNQLLARSRTGRGSFVRGTENRPVLRRSRCIYEKSGERSYASRTAQCVIDASHSRGYSGRPSVADGGSSRRYIAQRTQRAYSLRSV